MCDKPGFNTDYPPAIKNYIDQNDFQQSIRNINNTFPKTFYSSINCIAILFLVALALTTVGILVMIQGFEGRQKDEFGFIIMACIFIMVGFIICIFSCRCYINQIKFVEPMRRAIEQESKKYEERHCRWRLIKKKDEPTVLVSRRHQVEKFHVSLISRLIRFVVYTFVVDNY